MWGTLKFQCRSDERGREPVMPRYSGLRVPVQQFAEVQCLLDRHLAGRCVKQCSCFLFRFGTPGYEVLTEFPRDLIVW